MSSDNESVDSHRGANISWVEYYCGLPGHEFLCQVERSFIEDNFNLFGLKLWFPDDYADALSMILDRAALADYNTSVEKSAALLYQLIHARFILTLSGLECMREKFESFCKDSSDFGTCPRLSCLGQEVLPIGAHDEPYLGRACIYCPRCREAYVPPSFHQALDGAAFGASFPHMFFLTYPELLPARQGSDACPPFVPRVFGFKLHSSAFERLEPEEGSDKEQEAGKGGIGMDNACASGLEPEEPAAATVVEVGVGVGVTAPPVEPNTQVAAPRVIIEPHRFQQWEADASSAASPFASPWSSSLVVTPGERPGVNRTARAAPGQVTIAADGTVVTKRNFFHSPGPSAPVSVSGVNTPGSGGVSVARSGGDLSNTLLGGRCVECARPCLVTDARCLTCSHGDRSQGQSQSDCRSDHKGVALIAPLEGGEEGSGTGTGTGDKEPRKRVRVM